MKKIKKFIFFIGLVVVTFFSLIVSIVFISHFYATPIKPELLDLYKTLPVGVADKITGEVFVIKDYKSTATGFRPEHTNLFITNYHVVESMCSNGDCNEIKIKFNDNKDFYPFPLSIKFCSKWMDLCISSPKNDKPVVYEKENDDIKIGEEIFIINREDYFDGKNLNPKAIKGTVIGTSSSFLNLKLIAQHGFSGSPVFNSKGEFVALISSLDLEKEDFPILKFIGCAIRKTIFGICTSNFTNAVKINANYLTELIDIEKSLQSEMKLFIEEIKLQYANEDCNNPSFQSIFNHFKMYRYEEFCKKNPHLTPWQKKLGVICRSQDQFYFENFEEINKYEVELTKFNKLYRSFNADGLNFKRFCEVVKNNI